MDDGEETAIARDVAGALAWWAEAGVDLCFDDQPARWISPAQPTALEAERLRMELREAPPLSTSNNAMGKSALVYGTKPRSPRTASREDALDLSAFPGDPASFAHWWMTESSIDAGRSGGRVRPRGPSGAALMVLVPEPEAVDDERLLSGPQGRLLAAIIMAMGLREENVYVASALPRHTPIPDWADLAARGVGDALARHVALISPQRLVAFGSGILSLLDHSLPQKTAEHHFFTHEEARIPLFAARSLEAIIARPAWKAELWKGLLDWLPIAFIESRSGATAEVDASPSAD